MFLLFRVGVGWIGIPLEDIVPVATEHGVGLAAAGLAVGEDSYIEAVAATGNEGLDLVEDLSLRTGMVEHIFHSLIPLASDHPDLYIFLDNLGSTLSCTKIDYLSSSSEGSRGLRRTIVEMLAEIFSLPRLLEVGVWSCILPLL